MKKIRQTIIHNIEVIPDLKPGPKEERLKLAGDWESAVKKSLQKKRPAKGWPK